MKSTLTKLVYTRFAEFVVSNYTAIFTSRIHRQILDEQNTGRAVGGHLVMNASWDFTTVQRPSFDGRVFDSYGRSVVAPQGAFDNNLDCTL